MKRKPVSLVIGLFCLALVGGCSPQRPGWRAVLGVRSANNLVEEAMFEQRQLAGPRCVARYPNSHDAQLMCIHQAVTQQMVWNQIGSKLIDLSVSRTVERLLLQEKLGRVKGAEWRPTLRPAYCLLVAVKKHWVHIVRSRMQQINRYLSLAKGFKRCGSLEEELDSIPLTGEDPNAAPKKRHHQSM